MYNESVVTNKPKVDLTVKDADIHAVLQIVLTGNGINYRIVNNNLVILQAATESGEQVPDIIVSGKVTAADGSPLPGVSIEVK